MAVTVRRAQPWEHAEVGRITVEAYRADGLLDEEPSYAETLADAADRARRAELWVAAESGDVLGTVTFCPPGSPYRELATSEDQGEFRMLAVAPGARRRGIARLLVARCLERSRGFGHREVVICSVDTMAAAHALYGSFGFARAPELDWRPVPQILLIAFRLPLATAP